ncbi:MAG: hypothetical protein ABIM50_07540 [Novosphingobium sp.]
MQDADIAGSSAASDAMRDWEAVRASADIQYAPLPPARNPPPPEAPEWLKKLGQWLQSLFEPLGRALGVSWPVLQKVLIALAILGMLFLLWRLVLEPLLERRRQPKAEAAPEWAPVREHAVALLADADQLAAEGRFGEAAHLLLQRSINHIAEAQPDWLLPATTAREIAVLPSLPQRAREAFAVIAARVERSLYALRELDATDWQAARSAYADFALHQFAHAEPTA